MFTEHNYQLKLSFYRPREVSYICTMYEANVQTIKHNMFPQKPTAVSKAWLQQSRQTHSILRFQLTMSFSFCSWEYHHCSIGLINTNTHHFPMIVYGYNYNGSIPAPRVATDISMDSWPTGTLGGWILPWLGVHHNSRSWWILITSICVLPSPRWMAIVFHSAILWQTQVRSKQGQAIRQKKKSKK